MKERKKAVRLTPPQEFEIKAYLENILERLPDDGTRRCQYKSNPADNPQRIHTDAAAAADASTIFGYEVPASALGRVRKIFFGERRLPPKPVKEATPDQIITQLEHRVRDLQAAFEVVNRWQLAIIDYLTEVHHVELATYVSKHEDGSASVRKPS